MSTFITVDGDDSIRVRCEATGLNVTFRPDETRRAIILDTRDIVEVRLGEFEGGDGPFPVWEFIHRPGGSEMTWHRHGGVGPAGMELSADARHAMFISATTMASRVAMATHIREARLEELYADTLEYIVALVTYEPRVRPKERLA